MAPKTPFDGMRVGRADAPRGRQGFARAPRPRPWLLGLGVLILAAGTAAASENDLRSRTAVAPGA